MGLSSSQARLLNLTARMHDIEYKAQNLEAQKLQMANESRHVYQEYEDALNQQKVQLKHIGADGSANYLDATGADLQEAGYAFEVVYGDSRGKVYTTLNKAAKAAGVELSSDALGGTDGSPAVISNLLQNGFIILVRTNGATFTDGQNIKDIITADANIGFDIYESSISTDTNLQEVSDETMLKKAEAKYEADMRKINQKDKKFDTDLAAMDNERTAIKTEMDTLKTVAKDDIDRTFKLFS